MTNIRREISFYSFQLKQNLKNLHALRANSGMLAIGIVFGNATFYVVWLMFSHTIGVVNGWGWLQTLGMISMALFVFGLGTLLFGSVATLQNYVQSGSFDSFMTKPKNLYVRIINNEALPTAMGELLQGLVGLVAFCFLSHADFKFIFLLLVAVPPAVLAQISFTMVCDCIVFWLPFASGLGKSLRELIIIPTAQPTSLLRGLIRMVYLTAIPALLVAGVPVEIVTYHTYELIAVTYAVSIVWLVISVWFLKVSVRRYESGNVIG